MIEPESPTLGGHGREWQRGQTLLGKYRLLEPIGSGGMGVVYAAQRLPLGDVVAIKSIRPERADRHDHAGFLREARALARVRHPNVVQVFDFGEAEDGRPFMVMEYLDGPTLARVLAKGRLPLARTLEIFVDICRAVEAGHRRGVIHRDLKPGNVMFDHSDDGGETVKVLDFGLARFADDAAESPREGLLVGTCAYMSPEQIERGAGGPAADVFALGVMLYELVVGERPFDGGNPVTTIMRICEGEYASPRTRVPDLPDAVVEAIEAALQHDADARPASPLELAMRSVGHAFTAPSVSTAPEGRSGGWLRARSDERQHGDSVSLRDGLAERAAPEPDATEIMDHPLHADADAESSSASSAVEQPQGGVLRSRPAIATAAFVGRRLELESLLDLLSAGRADESSIAVVLGDPGMGRTRLLRRFAELAREQGAAVLEGRFWAYEGDRAAPGETYCRMLGPAGEGLAVSDPQPEVAPGFSRREGSAVLAAAFERHADGRPLVLVLDDLHLAGTRDLDFLTYLVRGRPWTTPVLVVASARRLAARSDAQTELSRWLLRLGTLAARTTLTLAPFDHEELRAWLDGVFGRLRILPRDLRRLGQASAGNPSFLSELVRRLVASERITVVDDPAELATWVCGSLRDVVLPEGMVAAVADQLSTLPEPLCAVLETAAVLGEQFRFAVLERVLGRASRAVEAELDECIDEAVRLDLLAEQALEGDTDLRFRSATVQQVLYERLGARRRRRIHQHVVEALLEDGPPEPIAARLAWHHREIGDWPNALRWGLHAARDLLARHAHDTAETALEHAAAAALALTRAGAEPSACDRLVLDALRGTLDARLGRFGEGLTRLRAAAALLDPSSDGSGSQTECALAEIRFEVTLELGRCHVGLGELELGVQRGQEALARAAELHDAARARDAEWNARVHLGHAFGRQGDWDRAEEALAPVVEATPTPRLRVLHVLALRELAWVEARRGAVDQASRHARQARDEAAACGDPLAEYHATSISAVALSAAKHWAQAIPTYQEALRGARALSLRRREMIELANLGLAQAEVGRLDEALRNMLAVIGLTRELGDTASAADARVGLGRVLRARGELDDAIASFRRGYEACEAVGRREYAAIALLELGRCELQREHWAAAREALLLARERLAALGSLHHWEVELALARAARGLGDDTARLEHTHAATLQLQAHATGDVLACGLAEIRALL